MATAKGSVRGCARHRLTTVRPPPVAVSIRAKSWKRVALPWLIGKTAAAAPASITSPNGANAARVRGSRSRIFIGSGFRGVRYAREVATCAERTLHRPAAQAQARDAAVGKDIEAHVADRLVRNDLAQE